MFVDNCRIVSVEGKSTAFVFLSVIVVLCRSRWSEWLRMFCRYLSHYVGRGEEHGFGVFVDNCRIVSVEGESTAMAFLSISVALCRSRVRLWRFVDNCRIVSVKGESAAFAFLSISVVLCRSRGRARLWRFVDNCRIVSVEGKSSALAFCRYLSHCVGQGGARLWRFVDNCRIVSVEGKSTALAFLSITVAFCRSMARVRIRRGCRARQRGCARYKHSF